MTFNIKSERTRIGLSQEEVARKLGVHVNTIRSWEQNETIPGSLNLMKLADFYGCTPDYLLGFSSDRSKKAGE